MSAPYTADDWADERHKYQYGHPDDPRPKERRRYGKSADRYPHTGDKALDAVLTKIYQTRVSVIRFLTEQTEFKLNPPDGSKPTISVREATRRAFILNRFKDDLATDIEVSAGRIGPGKKGRVDPPENVKGEVEK